MTGGWSGRATRAAWAAGVALVRWGFYRAVITRRARLPVRALLAVDLAATLGAHAALGACGAMRGDGGAHAGAAVVSWCLAAAAVCAELRGELGVSRQRLLLLVAASLWIPPAAVEAVMMSG